MDEEQKSWLSNSELRAKNRWFLNAHRKQSLSLILFVCTVEMGSIKVYCGETVSHRWTSALAKIEGRKSVDIVATK